MKRSTKQLIASLSANTLYLSSVSAIGLALSLYTLYVELRHENDSNYKALCDISQSISCSVVFASKYGKGFGILASPLDVPNCVFGALFYVFQAVIANVIHTNTSLIKFYLFNAVMSNLASVYLAYILIFVLHNLCVVCVTTYIVNFLMLLLAINRYRIVTNYSRFKKD